MNVEGSSRFTGAAAGGANLAVANSTASHTPDAMASHSDVFSTSGIMATPWVCSVARRVAGVAT